MPRPRREVVTEPDMPTEELEKLGSSISGINTNPEDWRELVEEARLTITLGEQNLWAKADIAKQAADEYGKLKDMCEELGQSYGYWRILSHVSGQYPKEFRDLFMGLSFAHFQIVAHREDRMDLLKKANDNDWSVARLKQEIMPKFAEIFPQKEEPNPNVSVIDLSEEKESEKFSPGSQTIGVTIQQAVELFNWIGKLDREVALGIGGSRRSCDEKLDNWAAEILDREPSGINVLDLFNLIFIGQGTISFDESAQENLFGVS